MESARTRRLVPLFAALLLAQCARAAGEPPTLTPFDAGAVSVDAAPLPEADPDSGAASDATAAPDGPTKVDLGSKCLTKCPDGLVCDESKWKGMCTHACAIDDDCGDAGIPAVCVDAECYRACGPGLPCQRDNFVCLGDPARGYCTSLPDAGTCANCPPPSDAGSQSD
ncbi:MAG TPA: hypothetical protein VGI39_11615 [Polyangiaceae bacterium]|jgi:hypothetical protein